MYIFWKYDLYPYLLGDIIDENKYIVQNNIKAYYTINYGSYFKPKFFLSNEEGKQLLDKLTKLKIQMLSEQNDIKIKYIDLLKFELNKMSVSL